MNAQHFYTDETKNKTQKKKTYLIQEKMSWKKSFWLLAWLFA